MVVTGFEYVSHLDKRVALEAFAGIVTSIARDSGALDVGERGE